MTNATTDTFAYLFVCTRAPMLGIAQCSQHAATVNHLYLFFVFWFFVSLFFFSSQSVNASQLLHTISVLHFIIAFPFIFVAFSVLNDKQTKNSNTYIHTFANNLHFSILTCLIASSASRTK